MWKKRLILLKRTRHIEDFLEKKYKKYKTTKKSNMSSVFRYIAGCVPLDHNFIKTLFHQRLFLQNILFKHALKSLYSTCVVFTLKACNFTNITFIIDIFVRNL